MFLTFGENPIIRFLQSIVLSICLFIATSVFAESSATIINIDEVLKNSCRNEKITKELSKIQKPGLNEDERFHENLRNRLELRSQVAITAIQRAKLIADFLPPLLANAPYSRGTKDYNQDELISFIFHKI